MNLVERGLCSAKIVVPVLLCYDWHEITQSQDYLAALNFSSVLRFTKSTVNHLVEAKTKHLSCFFEPLFITKYVLNTN